MSDTRERTTLPLLGFRAVRKIPRRKRSKKLVEDCESLPHDCFSPERVVVSDSDIQMAYSSSELKPNSEMESWQLKCLNDYRGYETEPVSPKTPPTSLANGETRLVTPMAPKKSAQETRNMAFFETQDNECSGICHSCGRLCRLRPSVPVCFRLNCALEYMNEVQER